VPTNGTLIFTNGDTTKTFTVTTIDDGVLNGDKTVLLSLSGLTGNSVFLSPSAATLTILETDGSRVVASGAALTAESGPVNGVIDPGETVSLLFGLRNTSGTNTVNLVSSLVATNGVTSPSGSQNYGSLIVHGPTVSRPFTFTASGTNGQNISAVFNLWDGGVVTNQAIFNFTLGRSTNYFTNNSVITINDNAAAAPYPSIIPVSGIVGLVNKATVTLRSLSHSSPRDIDSVLVSPAGQQSYLMTKCGGGNSINNVTITLDDQAASPLPINDFITPGSYQPASYASAAPPFPVPAPPAPYATNFATFNGFNPNGDWKLFIIDDIPFDAGSISNGWVLGLVSAATLSSSADMGVAMSVSSSNVVATSNVTYTIVATDYGPSPATAIVVTDPLPPGAVYAGSSPSVGTVSTNGGVVTWTIPSLIKDASATLTLTIQPGLTGLFTNQAFVNVPNDPNPDNNSASLVTTVVAPTADLAIGLVSTPNPVFVGGNLTYTIAISNFGPATATGVVVTNTLPPSAAFVSASPSGFVVSGRTVAFTNLGNLGSGGLAYATVVASPLAAGTITNSAQCTSSVVDPLKANNLASVKTVVESLQLTAARIGGNIVVSWNADAGSYVPEYATNLNSPVWLPVTNPPSTSGNVKSVTVAIVGHNQFFRLRAGP
jgi:uncharacterized repeat protein (TIGR01451 family)